MKSKTIVSFIIAVLFVATLGIALENKGEPNKNLYGGDRGKVPFPHRQHQNRLENCNDCHSVFPQEDGAIEEMKKNGTLKPKQVMNKQCIKCHRAEKTAGKKSGPLTCSKCHVQ